MGGNRAQNAGGLQGSGAMIDPALLALLACPVCDSRSPLRQEGEYLICTEDGTGFPIEDGIPRLLPESAISPDEMKERLK
jgi:uncharacterized protein YbaR (Trm112 family)